jgi:RNA polymerase sigma-B factor
MGAGVGRNGDALFTSHRNGEPGAREAMVQRHLPLAQGLARRYSYGREPLDDLVQVARVGLVKAVDRFDHERGIAFTSYAVPTILGELKRHLRDNSRGIHVPQRVQERIFEVERAAEDLRRRLHRDPTAEEVAKATGAPLAEVLEATEAAAATDTISLEAARRPNGDANGETYADLLGSEDTRYDVVEYEAAIAPALRALPARERLILGLRFGHDLTQHEIAGRLGLSQMHVSRLLRRALTRLRAVAEAQSGDAVGDQRGSPWTT